MSFTANIRMTAPPQHTRDEASVAAASDGAGGGTGFAQRLDAAAQKPEQAVDAVPVKVAGNAKDAAGAHGPAGAGAHASHKGARAAHAHGGRAAGNPQAGQPGAVPARVTTGEVAEADAAPIDPAGRSALPDTADVAPAGTVRGRAASDDDDSGGVPVAQAPAPAPVMPPPAQPLVLPTPIPVAQSAAGSPADAPAGADSAHVRLAGAIAAAGGNQKLDAADAAITRLEQASRGAVTSGRDGSAAAGAAGSDDSSGAIALPASASAATGATGALLNAMLQSARHALDAGAGAGDDAAGQSLSPPVSGLPLSGALDAFSAGVLQQAISAQPADAAGAGARQHMELARALGERLDVQLSHGIENATIRLDPPMKGSIEILVRQDQGSVQVHLRASDPDVQRQLQDIGDSLRQDLVLRNHRDVSVQVWDSARDQDGRSRQQRQEEGEEAGPGLALEQSDEARGARFGLKQQGEAA